MEKDFIKFMEKAIGFTYLFLTNLMGFKKMKKCIKCKKIKPLSGFNKSSYTKDGHGSRCRDCYKQYYAEHRDHRLAHNKQYNTEHKKQYVAYYAENRDRLLAYYKQYYTEHRAKALRQVKEWNKANHEKVSQRQRQYYRSPRGKAVLKRGQHKRRALLASCEINDLTTPQTEVLLQSAPAHCPICSRPFNNNGRKKSIDHIIPLSKEGNNTLSNVQIICLRCNLKKSNKLITLN